MHKPCLGTQKPRLGTQKPGLGLQLARAEPNVFAVRRKRLTRKSPTFGSRTLNSLYIMAKYEMREMPDLLRTGRRILYPRMIVEQQLGTEEWLRQASQGTTFSAGELRGMMAGVARQLALSLASGCTVKLEGLGTFSVRLELADGAERESVEADNPRRNARSIRVAGVHFRPDRLLVQRIDGHCELERQSGTGRLQASPYTPEERLQRALAYLDTHPMLNVSAYAELVRLSRTRAALELSIWTRDEATGLQSLGHGSHKVYVKRG